MSDIVTCPDCDAKMKLKAALPPGKKVRCPKCSTIFAPVSEAPKKPAKSPVDKERVVTTAPKARRNAVAAEREEEEEDRPRRRQSSVVDDEDSEEAGDDDRPRRPRKKRPRKSGKMGLVLGLVIGGGVLLVVLVGVGLVVLFVMGRKDSYKQNADAAKEVVACMEELASAMESVKDRDTAKQAAPRINKVCDRMENLAGRIEKLPKLTKAEDERLTKEFQPQFAAVNQRIMRIAFQAGRASQAEPSFMAAAQRLQQLDNRMKQWGRR